MKIRQGFVSNSSTSSFCIYGIKLDNYKEEIIKKLNLECDYYDDIIAAIQKIDECNELECFSAYCGGSHFLGKEWYKIKDDETGK